MPSYRVGGPWKSNQEHPALPASRASTLPSPEPCNSVHELTRTTDATRLWITTLGLRDTHGAQCAHTTTQGTHAPPPPSGDANRTPANRKRSHGPRGHPSPDSGTRCSSGRTRPSRAPATQGTEAGARPSPRPPPAGREGRRAMHGDATSSITLRGGFEGVRHILRRTRDEGPLQPIQLLDAAERGHHASRGREE